MEHSVISGTNIFNIKLNNQTRKNNRWTQGKKVQQKVGLTEKASCQLEPIRKKISTFHVFCLNHLAKK